MILFFFKQKTAYEMRISDWSSDVCSSDLFVAATGYVTDAKRRDGAVVFATPDANDADALNAGRWWKLRRDANWHRPDGMRDGAPNEPVVDVTYADALDRKSTRLNSSH